MSSLAILNPLGDFGIAAYTHELAEALGGLGVPVDVYGSDDETVRDIPAPRNHHFYPVIGSMLFRWRAFLSGPGEQTEAVPCIKAVTAVAHAGPAPANVSPLRTWVRGQVLAGELVAYLKSRKYDVIWTQWPDLEGYAPQFWTMCRMSGLKLVHTVHNVLPHERFAGDRECYAKAYRAARLLFVHSEHSRKMLAENFTFAASRVVLMHHGLYTIYPRRTEARQAVRKRLGIEDSQTMLLCCGSIRPYKNVSATIEAMKDPRCAGTVLVISGMEQEEGSDPLEHTRSDVERAGVADRVRLLPGLKPREEMAELFEACDVLMLPYLESYGSGLLLLGMTFGKHIVMTRTGGAEESLALYKEHTLLEGTSADCIAAGIARADYRIRNCPAQTLVTPELDWRQIAKTAMNDIEERVLRPRS